MIIRIAELEIDADCVDAYTALLSEEIEASVGLEPGVLFLFAVSVRGSPDKVRVIEGYADQAAYEAHLTTSHFLKYKTATVNMVRSLRLIETDPIAHQGKNSHFKLRTLAGKPRQWPNGAARAMLYWGLTSREVAMSISCRLCLRIVLLVALSLLAMSAPTKAAPLISHGAYSETATRSCTSTFSCTATFTPVTRGKTLVVHNLSCYVFHPPSAQPRPFRLSGNGTNVFIPLGNPTTLFGSKAYILNESVFVPFAAGHAPAASLSVTATTPSMAVTCTIGGELRP